MYTNYDKMIKLYNVINNTKIQFTQYKDFFSIVLNYHSKNKYLFSNSFTE